MNVVDSSGWLEYLADGPNADFFAPAICNLSDLIVPTISLYEVFKRVLQRADETQALRTIALMEQGMVIDLNAAVALSAARLSANAGLPMADSMMLATARAYGADLWTQDSDFAGMDGVRYIQAP
ncbi:MAG: type II toxin-antitoxin system VapC family toxin [Chloroflexi bacterium]|nr:type II toxin-antitoxin system VapC family toxin [Chloroflexota bacterium]